jgi:8-oxo-dGTP pyrophosphatase MutT (NUDIX family)
MNSFGSDSGPHPAPARLEVAATVVLLRDGAQGLETFLMRRAIEASVLGGVHVFPGGKLDAADPLSVHRLDRDAGDLHAALGEPELSAPVAAAIHVAALRELFEEAGVLLADGSDGLWQPPASALDSTPLPRDVPFESMLDALGLTLSSSLIAPWSRWITPVIPSMPRRRFDTRFFVARMPVGQTADVADHESTIGRWLGARQALEMYWQREIELAPPQIITLAHLSRYASADEAFDAARATPPRLIHPVHIEVDTARVFCYPGDVAHGDRERAFPGVSRLVLRDGRFEPFDGFEAFFADSPTQRL